jgi:hypothetical protein
VTDLDGLWLQSLQEVIGRAAHEVKDSLNGVSLNLEVVRSRTSRVGAGSADNGGLAAFSTAAVEQMELLTLRTEAMLFLARQPNPGTSSDVALVLRHLASLLIPAVKADGGRLVIDGYQRACPTSASAEATRLALARGLLTLTREGGSARCTLEAGSETLVRFSHESALAVSLDPAVASAIAEHSIRTDRSGSDLILAFPGL